jgi:hypothetical protein
VEIANDICSEKLKTLPFMNDEQHAASKVINKMHYLVGLGLDKSRRGIN